MKKSTKKKIISTFGILATVVFLGIGTWKGKPVFYLLGGIVTGLTFWGWWWSNKKSKG